VIKIHYAVQVCDVASNQGNPRYASNSRTEITTKCCKSLIKSIQECIKRQPHTVHHVMFFNDHSTQETVDYLKSLECSTDNLIVEVTNLEKSGIMISIQSCYEWLKDNGEHLIYQVQDDYLFEPNAIYEMVDMIFMNEATIVFPYNHPGYWNDDRNFKSRDIPTRLIPGRYRYWLKIYNVSCSFLTPHKVLKENYDLFEKLFSGHPLDHGLETNSVNRLMTERGLLGVMPVESIALHMQAIYEMDPYINWKERWESV
jgi:glycosyltransferase involved in cell wall biosynthesis